MAGRGRQPRSQIGRHHAEWLSLVQTSGPFLTVPVLERVLPEGLEAITPMSDLRVAYAEWQQDPGLQRRWIRWVLDELLGLGEAVSEATDADPSHMVAEQGVRLRASYVVRDRARDGDPAVLLVHRYEAGTALERPIPAEAWAASPLDRAAELARAANVPLALVTDGQRWTVVWAREGESTGTCTWRTELWLEEPVTVRAFVTLLGARRFFALPVEEGLAALLEESASRQQEVADQLGAQVRRAVELLIATLDREDRDRRGGLLADLESAEVYRGAVTVMMRLVFLFVAEERRLLPLDDERYNTTLAASTLRAQLQERADRYGEDPLERSTAAWHRVLALFRAVHGGIEHDALRLPAYGGGLFDPDRYPFLEGRSPGTAWREQAAHPLPVDDRTMLHLFDALQTLEQGGVRVLLSYRRSTSSRSATYTRACSTTPHCGSPTPRSRSGASTSPNWRSVRSRRGQRPARRRSSSGWPRRPAARPARSARRSARSRPRIATRGCARHAATTTACSSVSPRTTRCCAMTCAVTRWCSCPVRCSSPRRSTGGRPAPTTRRASWPRR